MITTSVSKTRREALTLLLGTAAGAFGLAACGSTKKNESASTAPTTGDVFVAQIPDVDHALVGIHVGSPDAAGKRTARAYVCDGKAIDAGGFALWFKGDIASSGETTLTATGRPDTLKLSIGATAKGSVTFANGTTNTFDARTAENGSGIYDVTVGADGSYRGTSTAGDVLDGTLKPGPPQSLSGTVKLNTGTSVALNESPAVSPIVPGTFTAVAWYHAGPNHLAMSGRSGDVRTGQPGLNVIGLCGWQ